MVNRSLKFELSPENGRMAGYGSFEAAIGVLTGAVAGGIYLAGDRFSAADVYVGSQIDWGLTFGTIPHHPALEAYIAPLRERAGYKRAKEIDNGLIAEMKAAQAG